MPRLPDTDLIHGAPAPDMVVIPATPGIFRTSAALFADRQAWRQWGASPRPEPAYGSFASATVAALEQRVARLEQAAHGVLCPSGISAISLVYQVALLPGDEVLVPANVYPGHRHFVMNEMARLGVGVRVYDPTDLSTLEFGEATTLVWVELPGSFTFEVPDIPALCAAAHEHGALVALDTTWGAGVAYAGFDFDIDFAVQSLSKFACGTSEVIMGSVATRDPALDEALRLARHRYGLHVSPMDAATVIAGLQSLGVRYRAQDAAARRVAEFLAAQPEVAQVLHPGLESRPGHAFWRRDCRAAAGLLSIVLRTGLGDEWLDRLLDGLRLFRLGYGWGGATSLVMSYDADTVVRLDDSTGQLLRFAIGLEDATDLLADLESAFRTARGES